MKLHLLRLMSRQAKMHMPYLPRYCSLILKQAASQTTGCDILNNLKQSLYSLPRSCYPRGDKVGHPQIKCTQHKSEYLPNCPSQLPNPQNLLAMRSIQLLSYRCLCKALHWRAVLHSLRLPPCGRRRRADACRGSRDTHKHESAPAQLLKTSPNVNNVEQIPTSY